MTYLHGPKAKKIISTWLISQMFILTVQIQCSPHCNKSSNSVFCITNCFCLHCVHNALKLAAESSPLRYSGGLRYPRLFHTLPIQSTVTSKWKTNLLHRKNAHATGWRAVPLRTWRENRIIWNIDFMIFSDSHTWRKNLMWYQTVGPCSNQYFKSPGYALTPCFVG